LDEVTKVREMLQDVEIGLKKKITIMT